MRSESGQRTSYANILSSPQYRWDHEQPTLEDDVSSFNATLCDHVHDRNVPYHMHENMFCEQNFPHKCNQTLVSTLEGITLH
jgi:hypothetical protein